MGCRPNEKIKYERVMPGWRVPYPEMQIADAINRSLADLERMPEDWHKDYIACFKEHYSNLYTEAIEDSDDIIE